MGSSEYAALKGEGRSIQASGSEGEMASRKIIVCHNSMSDSGCMSHLFENDCRCVKILLIRPGGSFICPCFDPLGTRKKVSS
jgi:hypothetical protein